MLKATQERPLIKLEIDDYTTIPYEEYEDETSNDFKEIEFEMITPIDFSDKRQLEIYNGINKVDERLSIINEKIEELNTEIDRLTNHADGIDYTVAVASGVIAGVIDSIFVGEFSFERANDWGTEKTNNFVVKIAQSKGYKGDDLAGAVAFLEDKYKIAADKATNDFGGGLQHHLRDFSHHPTPVGLTFSLLTQFTNKVYGTDVNGIFKVVELNKDDLILIGKNTQEKLTFGIINWFFHMVSDMAGCSDSILNGKTGTGLPGPIGSLLKELSALPIFSKMNKDGRKEFSVWISKLFNGTLLGERDENGKLIPLKFDLRTEIGIAHELGRQALPIILNECIVRGFYFIRRLCVEIRDNDIKKISDLKNINWKRTLPFKNRTIVRMMTIATGTFTAIDLADAGIRAVIKSGGFNPATLGNFILRVNFVGVGRFAIAVGSDVSMGVKRNKTISEKSKLMSEVICLSNVKIYYKNAELLCSYSNLHKCQENMFGAEANMWVEVEKTQRSIEGLYNEIEKVGRFYLKTIDEMDESFNGIEQLLPEVEKMNPGLVDAMLGRLKR
ncbi:hypothetical protein [Anaerocolumna sp. MB42-C2]|uniref:hypothetical protein n=1 Tax=Anaerocolumna sp. MB42-C2 TaxID=3070997 RepID=UPI0027E19C43|nr:hypothetical protein [Anaerocolumna sp. MB42-C2]WMJ89251.1 hypothetical protein RBU59_06925 [Anaerocolumna sp. MB42-C2]